jgi:hypothetical protein
MLMKYLILYLIALPCCCLSAQSVDWFETIGVKNYGDRTRIDPFAIHGFTADDSILYVGGSAPRSGFFHFYRSGDSMTTFKPNCCWSGSFVAQYSADGRFRWARSLGTNIGYYYQKMAMTSRNGAVYAAVSMGESGLVGVDSAIKNSYPSVLLIKFDKEGREVWRNLSNSFYWMGDVELGKLIVDENDNLYFSGRLKTRFRSLIFDSVTTPPKTAQFVFRFDAQGKAKEVTAFQEIQEGIWDMRVQDMQTDGKSVFLMMNPSSRNASGSCAIPKLRTDIFKIIGGKTKQIATFTCNSLLTTTSFGIADNGDFLVAGRYHGTIEVGQWRSPAIDCETDMGFVMRLNNEGRFIWFKNSPIANEYSDNYHLLREKDGNWLVAGYQQYDTKNFNISHRYPNLSTKYPSGKARIAVRRLSGLGVQLDSVTYYTSHVEEDFDNMLLAQNGRKTYLAGVYECFFDSLSVSTCATDGYREEMGRKIFIAQISDKVLKNKALQSPQSTPSVFSISPNPTSGYLDIRTPTPLDADAEVLLNDVNGRIAFKGNLPKGQFFHALNISDLVSGVYIMRIKAKEAVWTTKITKI